MKEFRRENDSGTHTHTRQVLEGLVKTIPCIGFVVNILQDSFPHYNFFLSIPEFHVNFTFVSKISWYNQETQILQTNLYGALTRKLLRIYIYIHSVRNCTDSLQRDMNLMNICAI